MRPIIVFLLMAWCLSMGAYAATAPDAKQITQELEQAKAAKPAQPETVESLQSALNALEEERKGSLERAQQYQQVIDNFPQAGAQTLRTQRQSAALMTAQACAQEGMTTDAAESGDPAGQQPASGKEPPGSAGAGARPRNCRLPEPASAAANRRTAARLPKANGAHRAWRLPLPRWHRRRFMRVRPRALA